ncbi:MAG: hypothetical protein FVQ82_13930 [Planctomycetes bacterium]|nr:hypothetical protein [Planctomycetota bacterium]
MSRGEFTFDNILDLSSEEVLRNFLLGYNHVSLSGIAIYHKTCAGNPLGPNDIDLVIPSSDPNDMQSKFHPYCRYYRTDCKQNDKCIAFDKSVALYYYSHPDKGPMLYRCHRELWEMAYPLKVKGKLVGVLFGGQLNLKEQDAEFNWSSDLKDCYEYIDWSFADSDETHRNQRKDVIAVIDNGIWLGDYHTKKLKEILTENDQEDRSNVAVSEINRRFRDFLLFGKFTTGFLTGQYNAKKLESEFIKQNAQIQFQKDCIMQLSNERPDNIRYWQMFLSDLLFKIGGHFEIDRVGFFHGLKNNESCDLKQEISFELVAMNTPKWWRQAREFKWDMKDFPGKDNTYKPGELPKHIARVVSDNLAKEKFFYVFPYSDDANRVYTLVILQNNHPILPEVKDPLKDILLHICVRDETVRSILREQEMHDAFSQHVVEVRHDLYTDLQIIIDVIERYIRMIRRGTLATEPSAIRRYDLVRQAIKGHEGIIETLTGEILQRKRRKFNPIEVFLALQKQVNLFDGVAKAQGIHIFMTQCQYLKDSYIFFDETQFNRGIQVLLDNAIKYSYGNNEINIECKNMGRNFIFTIENYGIGIPPETLKDVLKRKHRANIKDEGKKGSRRNPIVRIGQGLGLYIANEIFTNQLKGSIEISSKRASNVPEGTADFHRYITTVTIKIPVRF